MTWQMYPIQPKWIEPYENMTLLQFIAVMKTTLTDPAYGYIRNSFVRCGDANGNLIACQPNQIKARKQRAEDRACEIAMWMEDQIRNINNFKHCAPREYPDLLRVERTRTVLFPRDRFRDFQTETVSPTIVFN